MSELRTKLSIMTIEKAIYPEGQNPIYGKDVTKIKLDDESEGPFLVLSQSLDTGYVEMKLEIEELEVLANVGRGLHDNFVSRVKV